jgi:ribosome-associated protein
VKIKLTQLSEKISVTTDFIKLDAFLKFANAVPSGGAAKDIVSDGKVKVNGEVCLQRGKKLVPGDRVEISGKIFEVA